ncbi:MAG: hypothetical protein NVSMB19_01920 [Vulcanimicrobiaceae bacterium]
MKTLVALRMLALVVVALSIVVPWLAPAWALPRTPLLRRIAIAVGLGAQLGLTSADVARRRVPWTKLILPVAGFAAALEAGFASSFPYWLLGLMAAGELVVVAYVVVRALRAARSAGDEYPETVLEREYARLIDARAARFLALETTIVTGAARFALGGFRRASPAGFSYTRHSDVPLLLAVPVFVLLPEMIVFDLLIPHAAWGWRLASDALHVYGTIWALGMFAMFRARPHRVEGGRARLSIGAIRTLTIDRTQIASASVLPASFDGRAWRRTHAADGWSLTVPGAAGVEIHMAVPLAIVGIRETRHVWRLVVSADRPADLARALVAT